MINSPNPPQPPQRGQGQASPGQVSPGDSGRTGGNGDVKAAARKVGEEAKTKGHEQVENLRGTAAENLDKLAEGARAAASTLQGDDVGHLSGYVSDIAERMTNLSSSLRTKSGDEILRDVGQMARENPALFVTGSIALGFGLSRFARASQSKAMEEDVSPSASASSQARSDSNTWTPQTGAHDYAASGGGVAGSARSAEIRPGNPTDPGQPRPSGTQGGIH